MSTRRVLVAAVALVSLGACSSAVEAAPANPSVTPSPSATPSELVPGIAPGMGVDVATGEKVWADLLSDDECTPQYRHKEPVRATGPSAKLDRMGTRLSALMDKRPDLFTWASLSTDNKGIIAGAYGARWKEAVSAATALKPSAGELVLIPVQHSWKQVRQAHDSITQEDRERLGINMTSSDMRGFIKAHVHSDRLTHSGQTWRMTDPAAQAELEQKLVGCIVPDDSITVPASEG